MVDYSSRSRGSSRRPGRGRGLRTPKARLQRPTEGQSKFSKVYAAEIQDDASTVPNFTGDIEEEMLSDGSSSSEEAGGESAYASLLRVLNTGKLPPRKRRKLSIDRPELLQPGLDEVARKESSIDKENKNEEDDKENFEASERDDFVDDVNRSVESTSDDETTTIEPFEEHFCRVDEKLLIASVASLEAKQFLSSKRKMKEVSITLSSYDSWPAHDRDPQDLVLKKRLDAAATELFSQLLEVERDIASFIFGYRDVICGIRNLRNAGRLRDLTALHALNHIFKTRDRIVKNNEKLSRQQDSDMFDLRDQGFTRPKVLVILPTKNSCLKFVNSMIRLGEPEQQENKSRFVSGFADQDAKSWNDKPEDFQDLFGGNDDDMFRLGLKFTRKTIKYFSGFYNSDIILASPLGLMRAIEGTSGKDEQKKKQHDADFLSSIEVVIVDHANALLMQNWQHMEHVFSQLNLLPKNTRGCDISRLRSWYSDGHAKYLRQTIILSDFITPEINALSSNHTYNVAGKAKYAPTYSGAILRLPPAVPSGIYQTFTRIQTASHITDPDTRFNHFISTILPSLLPSTLIYIPSYYDFVKLRNHLAYSQDTTSTSFGKISEYTSASDAARARTYFRTGRHDLLLYTERAHHFRRYNIRGVKQVFFYGVPDNPLFWGDIIGFLGLDSNESLNPRSAVRAIFSKWDVLKLERIVGSDRVWRMVSDKGPDTYEFTR